MQKQIAREPAPQAHDENILVVKTNFLFPEGPWQGCKQVDFQSYIALIQKNREFLPRSCMEADERYKQIIPYLVFTYNNSFFLMERRAEASERRLASKLSLGIGGHIRQEDMSGATLYDWARREFYEEVDYQGELTIKPLGIINDDSNAVGRVHLGFAFLLEGQHGNIAVASELKEGRLVTLVECQEQIDRLESWSQLLIPYLHGYILKK